MTDKQIKAFRIAYNKIHEKSGWNNDLLKDELTELKKFGVDLENSDFLNLELDCILGEEMGVDGLFIENQGEKD